MNELTFREKDLYRPSWTNLSVPVVVLAVALAASALRFGPVVTGWAAAGLVAFLVPLLVLSWRSWTRVGRDGITICRGLGRGRTHPWSEVHWVDVRETKGGGTHAHAVRIHLAGGRRRSLPGLQTGTMYPMDEFDECFRQVVAWWKWSTDPSQRIRPGRRFRDRLTPQVVGGLLGLVIVAVVSFAVLASRS